MHTFTEAHSVHDILFCYLENKLKIQATIVKIEVIKLKVILKTNLNYVDLRSNEFSKLTSILTRQES